MYNIRRFPIEPTSPYYQPTKYNINSGGPAIYNAHPINTKPRYCPGAIEDEWYEGD